MFEIYGERFACTTHALLLFIACGAVTGPAFADTKLFRVSPSTLKPGITATLYLPDVHPKGFAVETPSKEWIYVVDASEKYAYFKDFARATQWSFQVDALEGIVHRDGKSEKIRVFSESGTYLFYFADNLETEPDNTFELDFEVWYRK